MKLNKMIALLGAIVIAFTLTACQNNNDELLKEKDEEIALLELRIESLNGDIAYLEETIEAGEALLDQKNDEIDQKNEDIAQLNDQISTLDQTIYELEVQLNVSNSLLVTAMIAVEYLDDMDMDELSGLVHPVKGVLFSPYTYVDIDNAVVFTAAELVDAPGSPDIYVWGDYDGIGDPIELNFDEYYDRFVYDHPFVNPHLIGNNTIIGTGNTIVNIEDVYPDGEFIEFHFTGFDPEFIGMDWRSLRLVFEFYQGQWYLVAIVHDEWTI